MTKYIELEEAVKTAMTLFAPVNTATQEIIETSLRNRLSSLPAADVAPVVHGRYIPDQRYRCVGNCGLCGGIVTILNNYCPNCGAHMKDGDGK